jgi:hypothetical protein
MAGQVGRMWQRVRGWFDANATHVTVTFIPDPDGAPLAAYQGYLRLWLAEGFLAKAVTWGNQHFPALHGGASLRFLGTEPTPFTTLTRPPGNWTVPGAQFDFQITPLLPFNGGTVEVEAALYQATVAGPLATAVGLIGNLASLMGPPLAIAAGIADKVSDGLDAILQADGGQPVLGVHWTMVAPGGPGHKLQPGHLAVVNAPPQQLGQLVIADGRLAVSSGAGQRPLTGVDYLVVRVECREERDDWRFPDLDELVRAAGLAAIEGHQDTFKARRTEAIARAWQSADLTPNDRKRVAKLVADEIDDARRLGAVPGKEQGLGPADRLLAPDAPELAQLRLEDLLTFLPCVLLTVLTVCLFTVICVCRRGSTRWPGTAHNFARARRPMCRFFGGAGYARP